MMRRPRLVSGISVGILIVILFLLPVLYAVLLAFESPAHFLTSPMTLGKPAVSNFSGAWDQADLGPELLNTILYSVVASAASTALGLLIAYPIARRLVRARGPVRVPVHRGVPAS